MPLVRSVLPAGLLGPQIGAAHCSVRKVSAGLKNTVLADCCERKILFWQDVNNDSVSWLASQPAGLKPAEHAHKSIGLVDIANKFSRKDT